MKKLLVLPLLTWLLLSLSAEQSQASLFSSEKKEEAKNKEAVAASHSNTALNIAVIDFRQIMQQSKQAKDLGDKIKKQFQPRAEKIKLLKADLEKKEAKFKRDNAVLTAEERRNTENDLVAQSRELQRLVEDYQQDLNAAQDQALQDLLGNVNKVVNKIAEKNHYDLILDKNRLPYVTTKLDITEQVLKEINS